MDDIPPDDTPTEASEVEHVAAPEALPSSAAPPEPASTSALSSAPATDEPEPPQSRASPPRTIEENDDDDENDDDNDEIEVATSQPLPQTLPLAEAESISKTIDEGTVNAATSVTPAWEATQDQVMRDMQTSDQIPTSTPPRDIGASQTSEPGDALVSAGSRLPSLKMDTALDHEKGASSGRGRRGGRPRGRARGSGRGSKRKRERSDEESEDSEIYTPVVTTTKSGRSVQKPSSFVPPPASPTSSNKRKRSYRKNPESAVCKVCLRGTSPANNMIVFCDGCNSPYHRYCHQPPIDQAVVDEIDKEWYCKQCEKERVAPVPDSEVANFISAEGAPLEQRQRYFASLSPGMLVTLLTKATTLKPDLPLFAPDFRARVSSSAGAAQQVVPPYGSNGHAHPQSGSQQFPGAQRTGTYSAATYSGQYAAPPTTAGAMHTAHAQPQQYMQQYQSMNYGPDVHPPNYPRPGQGLMRTLPPEQEDLQWLVEEDNRYGVFSHMYQVDPQAANAGMNGGMARPAQ